MRIILEQKDLLSRFTSINLNETSIHMFAISMNQMAMVHEVYLIDENENIVKVFKDVHNRLISNQYRVKLKKDFLLTIDGYLQVIKKDSILNWDEKVYHSNKTDNDYVIRVTQEVVNDNPDYFELIIPEKKYSKDDLKGYNSSMNSYNKYEYVSFSSINNLQWEIVNTFIEKLK